MYKVSGTKFGIWQKVYVVDSRSMTHSRKKCAFCSGTGNVRGDNEAWADCPECDGEGGRPWWHFYVAGPCKVTDFDIHVESVPDNLVRPGTMTKERTVRYKLEHEVAWRNESELHVSKRAAKTTAGRRNKREQKT